MKKNKYILYTLIASILLYANYGFAKQHEANTLDKNNHSNQTIYKKPNIEKRIRSSKAQANKIYEINLQVDFVAHIELPKNDIITNYSIGIKELINVKIVKNTLMLTAMASG
ncbi:MAG: hypothetical protein AAFO15_02655, partial [Pseudomonadota bacterium]